MKTDVIIMHDQNLLRNLLYNIFVHPPMTKVQGIPDQMNIQIDIAVEVHLVKTSREITIPIIDKDLHLESVTIMIKILLLPIALDHVIITFKNTLLHIDLLQDLEIPDTLDLVQTLIHEIKSIILNHHLLQLQIILKYTCITQQKWQMH